MRCTDCYTEQGNLHHCTTEQDHDSYYIVKLCTLSKVFMKPDGAKFKVIGSQYSLSISYSGFKVQVCSWSIDTSCTDEPHLLQIKTWLGRVKRHTCTGTDGRTDRKSPSDCSNPPPSYALWRGLMTACMAN